MQTLWSRALQAKCTCRCPSCLPPQRTVARRVNTAPSRRHLQPGDVFSALFSTTIVVSAAADAAYKSHRRDDLDRLLLQEKDELRVLQDDQARRLQALEVEESQRLSSGKGEYPWTESREEDSRFKWSNSPRPSQFAHPLRPPQQILQQQPQPVPEVVDAPIMEQSQTPKPKPSRSMDSAKLSRPKQYTRDTSKLPWTTKAWKQRTTIEPEYYAKVDSSISTDKLTRVLLDSRPMHLQVGRPREDVWASRATHYLHQRAVLQRQNAISALIHKIILRNINRTGRFQFQLADRRAISFTQVDAESVKRSLREIDSSSRRGRMTSAMKAPDLLQSVEPLPMPPYEWVPGHKVDDYIEGVARQEDELIQLFAEPKSLDELLSRLCSVLAGHRFAPNIHMFNILLVNLSRLQLNNVALDVVDAVMKSGIKSPNEITFTAIFNCLADNGRAKNFVAYLDSMDGVSGVGAYSAGAPGFNAEQPPTAWIKGYDRAVYATQQFEKQSEPDIQFLKPPRTQYMYEAILSGLLKFSRGERALQEYTRMIRSGIQPTINIYKNFLRFCVKTKAWSLGWNIWTQLSNDTNDLDHTLYYWMLQLCAFCDKSGEFKNVMRLALQRGAIKTPLDIAHFRWSEIEYDEVVRKSEMIDRLERPDSNPGVENTSVQLSFEATCPANLHTLVQKQLSVLVKSKSGQANNYSDYLEQDHTTQKAKEPTKSARWVKRKNTPDQHLRKISHQKLKADVAN